MLDPICGVVLWLEGESGCSFYQYYRQRTELQLSLIFLKSTTCCSEGLSKLRGIIYSN